MLGKVERTQGEAFEPPRSVFPRLHSLVASLGIFEFDRDDVFLGQLSAPCRADFVIEEKITELSVFSYYPTLTVACKSSKHNEVV
jgi:hypothetical protein